MNYLKHSILSIIAIVAVFLTVNGVKVVMANPSFFPPDPCRTSSATTSPSLFQAATATTTVVTCDFFYPNTQGVNTKSSDAALFVQFAGTNTPSLNLTYQYSQDNVDWYDDNYQRSATSYPYVAAAISNIISWTSSNATTSRVFYLPTPTRYVRVQAKMTTAPGSVWVQIVPNKERQN